ncbi:hypothetical protein GW796_08955 [archaeon]|nr:hypothetical protein [archaeon]NCQ52007.1 hypothetical protein [archaeon]
MSNNVKAIFLVFFAALIAAAIWFSSKSGGSSLLPSNSGVVVLKGVVTSEKEKFFKDERVKAEFINNGFDVQVTRMTSDKITAANKLADFGEYADFVFPSSVPVSEKVKSTFKSSQAHNVFYSPMVIAT